MRTPAQDSAGPRSAFLHTRYRAHFDRKLSHLLRLPPPSERAIAIGKDGHLLHVSPRWAMAHTTLPISDLIGESPIFSKKMIFGSKTKKKSRQIFATVEFKPSVHERFQPRIKRQKNTRRRNRADESAAMIEGWNSKHLWKHVCMQAAREVVH